MPKRSKLPVVRLFRPRRLAYIKIKGHRFYLGPWGDPCVEERYRAKVCELLGIAPPVRVPMVTPVDRGGTIVVELVEHLAHAYECWARDYYRKRDKPTATALNVSRVRQLLDLTRLGTTPLHQVDGRWLLELQVRLITDTRLDLCRGTINDYVAIVVRMLKWGSTHKFVPGTVLPEIEAVPALRKGRSIMPGVPAPREGKPKVEEAPRASIRAARRHLSRTLRIMLDLQLVTGMRPNEVCNISPQFLSHTKRRDVMIYRVPEEADKTDHVDERPQRRVYLGPRAMRLLRLAWPATPAEYFFSPSDAESERMRLRRMARKTKVWESHSNEARRRRRRAIQIPPRQLGEKYSPDSYRRAIERACTRAGVETFTPYQLRHNRAGEIVARASLEIAQEMLGHADIKTTMRYVKVRQSRAIAAAAQIG